MVTQVFAYLPLLAHTGSRRQMPVVTDRGIPMEPALLTIKQVAELVQLSLREVFRWQDRGIIPGRTKLGRLVRFNRAAVLTWIEDGCPQTTKRKQRCQQSLR